MSNKLVDSEGFLLLEKEFRDRGFNFSFVQELDDGWMIYKKSSKNTLDKYELVKPRKQKEWNCRGKIIPKKYRYPSDEEFGHYGYDCMSLDIAIERHKEILSNRKEKEEKYKNNKEIAIPEFEFSCSDLLKVYAHLNYSEAYSLIKEWLNSNKIVKSREKKNKTGKPSILYKIKQ